MDKHTFAWKPFLRRRSAILLALIAVTLIGMFPTVAAVQPEGAAATPEILAKQGITDLLHNFWSGTETDGHFLGVCNNSGLSPDAVGCMWEQAQSYNALYGWWKLTGDAQAHNRLVANWNWIRKVHPPEHWGTCGWHTEANYASDDTAWDAGMALEAYDVTHDPVALDSAKLAVACAYHRWGDGPLDEGIWYSDDHWGKSLYQATLALDAIKIYDQSHDKLYLSYARGSYDWMERKLLRGDGLYWCDANAFGPLGRERPFDFKMAHSVVFLEGAMAMGLLHDNFFLLTGDPTYKTKAIASARAILSHLVDPQGILVDDRDAWVNGFYAEEWATKVLPLSPDLLHDGRAVLRRTAVSIATNDRSPDGHYGGDWCGPVDLAKSVWGKKGQGTPAQPQTNANAVDIIISALATDRNK